MVVTTNKSADSKGTKKNTGLFADIPTRYTLAFLLLITSLINASIAASSTTEPSNKLESLPISQKIDQQNTNPPDPAANPLMTASAIGAIPSGPNTKFPQAQLSTIPEDENSMRLLEIRIGKYKLEDLIIAHQIDDMIFIPLGFFSELIDLAITTDPDSGIGKGFIFKEDRIFHLDSKRGEITIKGKLSQFNKQRAALRNFDDIYVDSNLIGEWFNMTLDIDLYGSRLTIISKVPLPFEQRKKREERMKMVHSRLPQDRGYPKQEFPYQPWSNPLINQTARIGLHRDTNEEISNTFGYTTYATADLMHMESTWYLSGTDDDLIKDARGTLSRHDPAGSLLGAAHATEYAFGHISEPRLDNVTRPLDPQIGALVSNYPLSRQLQYDSHNFRGDLPPGWEVELYRNNDLLGYLNSSENGQYQFDDIPILFGSNYFRLIFYGPQGQQREETHNFTLDHALTEPGKHYYRALASRDDDFSGRMLAQYDFGFSKNISLNANFASIPLDDKLLITGTEKSHNYITGGIRGFYNSLFYRSDLTIDMQSGSAINWRVQSRLASFIFNMGETYFQDNFISEEFPESFITIKRRSELKIDTAIPASFLPRIPVSFEVERKSYAKNVTITRYSNRISVQQYGLSISNTLNRNQQTGLQSFTTGNLQASRRAFGYNFRGSTSYELSPNSELSTLSFTMDGIKLWDYHFSAGLSHTTRSETNELLFNMTRSKGKYSLGLNSRYSTGGIMSIDLTFSIGVGIEPRTNKWKTEYRPIASQGSISVQTFLDNNLNGIKDADEKGIPDSKVKINGGNVNKVADEEGIIFITGIEPYKEIDVGLSLETLDDPLWQPAIKGRRVSLRPGHIAKINFPVIITGEIDGTAFIDLGSEQREVSGVRIELVDLAGKIIKTAKTAYDGFYLLDKIPAGKYQIRVSQDQTEKLGLVPVEAIFVDIEPEDPIVNGMDFVLQKRDNLKRSH